MWGRCCHTRIQDYFGENGLPLSDGSIYNFLVDAHALLEDFERWAVWDLYRAEYLHFDETGVRVSTKGAAQCVHSRDKPLYAPSPKGDGGHECHGNPAPFSWRSHP